MINDYNDSHEAFVFFQQNVEVDPRAIEAYKAMILQKDYAYLIFQISDNKVIIQEKGDQKASYSAFLTKFRQYVEGKKECRYGLATIKGHKDGELRAELVLISYCVDDAPIRMRMLYSAAFGHLKVAFKEIRNIIITSNGSELTEKNVKRTFHFDD
ncbi:unnamed protein product [Dracunculus medinensis]|uniref:ADF-H domain-containing protein n=1 Tax=Dracunculus medinensis TaxID=318479 RepID=A0A0N4URS4_DRAME|nr:unnamed protein product [Dracunculus medinensis]